jgi:hypothetical protein
MSGTDPFRVLVKQSAVDRNSAVAARVTDPPTVLEFASKTAAQSEAATLTKEGDGPVRVQAVAPQDDTDADAYLVGASRSGTEIPETPPSAGWTFGVDGDQYGALGEALLTAGDGVTRPLESYVRHDLGLGTDRFGVVGEQEREMEVARVAEHVAVRLLQIHRAVALTVEIEGPRVAQIHHLQLLIRRLRLVDDLPLDAVAGRADPRRGDEQQRDDRDRHAGATVHTSRYFPALLKHTDVGDEDLNR